MKDIIQLLPDSVANQIAAGEVIQRPASVIKELVENSIDAGATKIIVVVTDAGRTSIQVIDDGKGMTETDARLAFERHATSKISKAEDLFNLHTMGFRGEALASVAAVAQVELKTRTVDNEVGTCLSIAGSKVTGQEPVACAVGSIFKIDNLFYNVPARRKFLKSNATELNNIMTAYERIVLVYPEIEFQLISNGTELINLHKGTVRHRVAELFGKKLAQDLLPVEVETSMCRITGFVGKPESARKKASHEYFFVNGRYMKHPYFHKAVQSAFERMVPVGMHVPYFIYFEVEPTDIDVNIHPTKTEIKFENEQVIWQILTAAVKDALGKFCEVPTIDFDTEGKPEIPVLGNDNYNIMQPATTFSPTYNPFNVHHENRQAPHDGWQQMYDVLDNTMKEKPMESTSLFDDDQSVVECESKVTTLAVEEKSPSHYQYKGKYIMTAVKSGLMIIDQHRADVRIKYEHYLAQMTSQTSRTQKILFPELIQFSPSEAVVADKLMPEMSAIGYQLENLGHNAYSLNGVPAGLEGVNHSVLLHEIVIDAAEGISNGAEAIRKSIALTMAQRSAVTEGEVLNNMEMENIVNQLFGCSNVNYTPDGKTILCIFAQKDIEQLMG
ncbi:MAG: DNA mismatch repair endonuclease MutL [Prevotella sp.]|nr:DNA mismatch repair endonuclease MutL [Prevotellaceae bacterium]MDD7097592.1 DNA mismatch repair endonuclease MutL [Prevotellaceae bacterium]MDY5250189.1 DNA mismatch repair endonuclease MutL [Prevotella sp.]